MIPTYRNTFRENLIFPIMLMFINMIPTYTNTFCENLTFPIMLGKKSFIRSSVSKEYLSADFQNWNLILRVEFNFHILQPRPLSQPYILSYP